MLDFDLLTPKNITKQKSILLLLVEERGNSIIQHPLIEALISLKWKKMKLIFLLLLIAHVCFVSTLSVYAFALVHSGDVSETSSFIWMVSYRSIFGVLCVDRGLDFINHFN